MADLVAARELLAQAETLADAGDTAGAVDLLRIYLFQHADDRIALSLLARCIGDDHPEAAIGIMHKLLAADPKDIFARHALVYYQNRLNLRQYSEPGAGVYVDGPWAKSAERPAVYRPPQLSDPPPSPNVRHMWRWWLAALVLLLLALVALLVIYLYNPSFFGTPNSRAAFSHTVLKVVPFL